MVEAAGEKKKKEPHSAVRLYRRCLTVAAHQHLIFSSTKEKKIHMKINFPPAYTVVFRILWMQFLVIYNQIRKYFLFMLKQ